MLPQDSAIGKTICTVLLVCIAIPANVLSGPAELRLTFDKLSEWREKSFKGRTRYSQVQHDGKTILRAEAAGTASGLYHKISVRSAELPLLKWSWKVKRTIAAENPYKKEGDDFAARMYVVFSGTFFWQTRALVYVWSDKLPVGTVIPNSYTNNAAMIAVESGNRHAGKWRHEERNYVEDYRLCFKSTAPDPSSVAVMSDADNTGSEAVAWYGDIIFAPGMTRNQ